MKTIQALLTIACTLALLALVAFGGHVIFRYAADLFVDLEPGLSPAFKAGLVAGLLGVLLITAALHWNAARRRADTLRTERVRLYGRLLETLAGGSDPSTLGRQLALLGSGGVIRAWRDVRTEPTPENATKLLRAMRRELGQGGLGFGDDALLDLLDAERAERASTPLESGATS